ncbi:MAG TPA: ABC transporter permease [Acidimicrobiales bacterium]
MTITSHASAPVHHAGMVRELVVRQIRLRYSGSVLGLGWSQLAALAQAGVLIFIFGRVVRLGIPNYAAFVLVGMVPWLWFVGAIGAAADSVVSGRDLIRRPGFPSAVLPLVAVGVALINFVLMLPITLVTVGLVTGRVPARAMLLPVVAIVQLVVMLGPAYLVATVNVFLRDTGHLVSILLGLLFYATPVFYAHVPSHYHLIVTLNPMAHLVAAYRQVLLYGTMPSWGGLAALMVGGVAVTLACYRVFVGYERWFAEEL